MFDYTRNESYAAGLHLRLKRNVRCDSLNCGSRHCGSKKLLASRLSYKFAISPCIPYTYICILYIYIYTFIYICMYKNIMCRRYRRACPWIYIYIYINGKVGGGNRVTPKYFSAPFHFRLGDVSARIIERIRWCMCAKHSKMLATIMNRFDAFMHKVLW